jgi:hypothetical protein
MPGWPPPSGREKISIAANRPITLFNEEFLDCARLLSKFDEQTPSMVRFTPAWDSLRTVSSIFLAGETRHHGRGGNLKATLGKRS